ncbi:uncharacterized protein EV154DRAFT_569021 [Mucor mucedo]|uniref:uncharacterized protein n=1 Tax=Mucor mucedo TaxID=29922 RepID=UPI00221FE2E2|nr:uncharacterized protein EV154DRAFT_569021 [Mucor mucedo]KAI7877678.1 hypothetical protein EV154DRAFT_569021 [Mucor mucedo]
MNELHRTTVLTRRRSAADETEATTKMNFSSLCNGLKSHLSIRVSPYVERVSGGPHTETERERWGDVAVQFAEVLMLCHISQGGLFVKDLTFSVWKTFGVNVLELFNESTYIK